MPLHYKNIDQNLINMQFKEGASGLIHRLTSYPFPAKPTTEYTSEMVLVNALLSCLGNGSQWGPVQINREFFYQRGRTDVVALTQSGEVVAFEAKLEKWREALQQAYRNTCFAHRSYVLLPIRAAMKAFMKPLEFESRRIGLCCVLDERVEVLLDAPRLEPIQPWLTNLATSHSTAGGVVAKSTGSRTNCAGNLR